MQYTKAKENGCVARGYAQASAGAHAPAYAQHTTARTYTVYLTWGATISTPRERNARYENITTSALVRIIALKHANGYKLEYIFRRHSGTYIIRLAKRTTNEHLANLGLLGTSIGLENDCPIRDALVWTQEGTQ